MLWAAVIGTFLVPIYYQARDKGYKAGLITALAGLAFAFLSNFFFATGDPRFLIALLAVLASILVVLVTIRPRPGSPGTSICANGRVYVIVPETALATEADSRPQRWAIDARICCKRFSPASPCGLECPGQTKSRVQGANR